MQLEAYSDGLTSLKLEAKPGLHFDDPGAQRSARFSEMRVLDIRHNPIRIGFAVSIQVELVEKIVEVGAKLQPCAFPDKLHLRQTERLAKRGRNCDQFLGGSAEHRTPVARSGTLSGPDWGKDT
jgi:hypothetical protein